MIKKIMDRFKEREEFMSVYTEFYEWLKERGFEWDTEDNSVDAYDYNNHGFTSYSGIESYYNKTFKYGVRFVLDNDTHRGIFTHGFGSTEIMSLDEMKQYVIEGLTEIRDKINSIKL